MGAIAERVHFGGQFSGVFAYPERAQTPLPAVVVIQEAWGVDAHIQDVARRFALAGYAALAPEVYARDDKYLPALAPERTAEMRTFFDDLRPEEIMDAAQREAALSRTREPLQANLRESIGALFASVNALETYLPLLVAATKYLRDERAITRGQKIGSIGFCMGGALSALLASADAKLAAAVIFYGGSPGEDAIARVGCPVLGFYGGNDSHTTDGVPAFAEAMKKHGKSFEQHVYEGAGHAFFNDERPAYDVRAARDAFPRVLGFFRVHLT